METYSKNLLRRKNRKNDSCYAYQVRSYSLRQAMSVSVQTGCVSSVRFCEGGGCARDVMDMCSRAYDQYLRCGLQAHAAIVHRRHCTSLTLCHGNIWGLNLQNLTYATTFQCLTSYSYRSRRLYSLFQQLRTLVKSFILE